MDPVAHAPDDTEIPIPLFRVLELEWAALRGDKPPELSWTLDAGQLRGELAGAADSPLPTGELSAQARRLLLLARHPASRKELVDRLNERLHGPCLYHQVPEFPRETVATGAIGGLIDPPDSSSSSGKNPAPPPGNAAAGGSCGRFPRQPRLLKSLPEPLPRPPPPAWSSPCRFPRLR
jgi:hypothetical protein